MPKFSKYICLVFLLLCSFSMLAQKKTRKELETDRKRLKKEIKKVNKLLFAAQKQEKGLLDDLRDINQKIRVRNQLIATINLESEALTTEISKNEREIGSLNKKLTIMKKDYGEMIYKSYKSKSHQSKTLFLLSSKSFNQAYKRLKYMDQYADFRKKQGLEIVAQTAIIKAKNDSLAFQKQLKDTLLSNEKDQKEKIELDKKKQEKLVTQIKRKERKYKRELNKKIAEEKKVSEAIDKIIREAIAKANAKKGVKKSTGFALSPEAKALASRFEQNKGNLPWPVESGLITRRFGKQPHPTIKGITIQSTGVHFVTDSGNNAESIFNGKVLSIQTLSEGRKSVLVQHGNYITAYNNLEQVYVAKDDTVKTGQALGKIFTDKITRKTKLIFVLFKDTKRLNPANWIARR